MKKYLTIIFIFTSHITFAQLGVNYQWAKSIGSGFNEISNSITVDNLSNIYISGFFQDTVDFNTGSGINNLIAEGNLDLFFAKYDSNGSYLWANSIGSIANDNMGYSIFVDSLGNVYLAGYFNGTTDFDPGLGIANLTSLGNRDGFFAKYDTNGNFIWAKSIGSTNWEECQNITGDNSGNVYITGYFEATIDFDPGPGIANLTSLGNRDGFFAKYDTNGNFIWAKSLGGINNTFGTSISVDVIGNTFITGYYEGIVDFDPNAGIANLTSNGNRDIFLAKYDSNGSYLWSNSIGGSTNDYSLSIVVGNLNNIYITGFFEGTADFDPSAGIANLISNGNRDIFLAKYDSNGSYLWANSIGGSNMNEGNNVTLDNLGNVYITGYFFNTAYFDPSVGIANLTSEGFHDIFFAKYDENGNYIWANNVGSSTSIGDIGNGIAVDASGNIHLTGYFSGVCDFDPNIGISNLTSNGDADIFFAKYSPSPLSTLVFPVLDFGFQIYPNPSNGLFTISVDSKTISGSTVVVYDIVGQCIFYKEIDKKENDINLTSFPKGIYLVKLNLSGESYYKKVVRN